MELAITKGAVSDINVSVNSTDVTVQQANNILVEVTPTPNQTINIDRGLIGPQGPQGEQGPQGPQGVPGQGVPTGGTVNQILTKSSSVDYDDAWQSSATLDYLQLNTAQAQSIALGKLRWNSATATAAFGIIDGTVECNIGEQVYAYVTNADSVTIQKGQPVYLYAATGNRASVKLAGNLGDSTSAKTLGLATQSIAPNQTGFVTTQGVLDKIDTSAFAEGDTLYLGATAGTLTNVKPKAPNHLVYIGVVERANNGNGQIYVKPQNGYELDELHDVQINSPSNGQTILYDASTSLWKNANLSAGTGISVTNGAASATITNTAPDQTVVMNSGTGISVTGTYPNFTVTNTSPSSGGTVTSVSGTAPIASTGGTTPTISISQASTSTNGYLSSTDWNTFNNKSNTNGTVTSVSGTGTVSGISLSGTVTSSGNLTLGGALDLSAPPTIGNTTPNTGAFTTLTAQTEVLKGTGQNLFNQSNNFTTGWTLNAATPATTIATTDPTGGSNAWKLAEDNTTAAHYIFQIVSCIFGITYTASFYVKAAERNFAQIAFQTTAFGSNAWANFNLSTGTIGSIGSSATATIQSIGNGWYRCSMTATATATGSGGGLIVAINADTASRLPSYVGTTGNGIYIYGAQQEIGSVTNTYVPTTTTAVYGTPSLSFSGVSSIGLQSDGSLYVSPAGTGAIQAQATTSSATGGNARGANAVDWQTVRGSAGQVASNTYSVISGGTSNTSSAFGSTVGGGNSNTASGSYAVVAGGIGNNVSGTAAFVGGGHTHTAAGYFNFIGGGYLNTGTASAAVTTQATTTVTSGSTAVTLSGSNASIKVGQLITGTGIVQYPHTYVAAISGTSLTLSQNANATGTPTLSFFTPHGVVVGGGNNQATGSYSFIGGGGDAGTAANRNVASGDWGVVVGGIKNTSSGNLSSVLCGSNNTASGVASVICGGGVYGTISQVSANTSSGISSFIGAGFGNISSSNASFVGAGINNISNGLYSAVTSGAYGTTRAVWGNHVIPSLNPFGGSQGTSQSAVLVLGKQTTDATASILTCDGNAGSTTNQVILPNNSAYLFSCTVIAGVTGGGNTSAWKLEGAIKRGATAGSTAIVGSVTKTLLAQDAGASTWVVNATADTTNGGLAITVTGQAATTIRWVCKVETTEMTY